MQDNVRVKREWYEAWSLRNNAENWEKYKSAKKETKKAMGETTTKAFDKLYQSYAP